MKFCTNCGHPLEDEQFCTKCGAKVEDSGTNSLTSTYSLPVVRKSSKKAIPILIILTTIIAVVVLFPILAGRSYKSTVKSFVYAVADADAKKMVSVMPDEFIDYVLHEEGLTKKEFMDFFQIGLENLHMTLNENGVDAKDIKRSYNIVSERELRGDDWRELRDSVKEEMDMEIDAAKEISVDIGLEGNNSSMPLYLVKIGRSWYVLIWD